MSRLEALMQVLGFLLAVVASGRTAEANPEQAKVLAEIEELGGKVTFGEKSPDKPVIGLSLNRYHVTDVRGQPETVA